ncbi:hypothetical protein HispidOSU_001874, partial [Sigmodon hispidus]
EPPVVEAHCKVTWDLAFPGSRAKRTAIEFNSQVCMGQVKVISKLCQARSAALTLADIGFTKQSDCH